MAYSGPVVDPFRIRAPNGRTYFDVLSPPHGLVSLYTVIYDEIRFRQARAAASTDPTERAFWNGTARMLQVAIGNFERKLAALAVRTASVADQSIDRHIFNSQVRPDTSKARHMSDNIRSEAVPMRPEGGVVGIAHVATLNRTRRGRKGAPYWEAQEFGTDAHVGRVVRGFFMPGRSRPSQAEYRHHPEFKAGGGPPMEIQEPIEERAFLRRGIEDAGRYRSRHFLSIKADLGREMAKVMALTNPAKRNLPGVTSRRGRK